MHAPSRRSLATTIRLLAVPVGLTMLAGVAGAQAGDSKKVDPRAVDALRRMGTYLRSLQHFGMQADAVRDQVVADNQKVTFGGTVRYVVRAPNKLRADVYTDRKQRQFFYDGTSFTEYAPRMKYYATIPAPKTLRDMLDTVRVRHQIELPIADLFLWGTPRDGIADLTSARYIGPAYVKGVDTDQYAFRQAGVDWQLWIDRGAMPLPRRLVITTTTSAARPEYAATLTWDLSAPANDSVFTFVPPKGAVKIPLATVAAARSK